MSFIIIIPARYFSTRFPGKPLAKVKDKPMIVYVMEKALISNADKVIVATDHVDIMNTVKVENTSVEVILTSLDHQSGTERLEEVINYYGFSDDQIIVNLQGDEPLISSNMINLVANDLLSSSDIKMSTLAIPIISINEINNLNIVKVVVDMNNYALYFSRSVIPCSKKNLLLDDKKDLHYTFLRHIGIYSYRVDFIRRYVDWQSSMIERLESLEQLRVLWHGEKIHVAIIDNNINYINVDTPEELNAVNLFLEN